MCGCVQIQGDMHGCLLPEVHRYKGPALVDERLSVNHIIKVSGVIDGAISDVPAHNTAAAEIVLPFHLHVLLLCRGQHHVHCCGVCFLPFVFVWD